MKNISNNYNLTIIAVVAALALLGIVVVTLAVTIPLQQAEAAKSPTGQCASFFQNSSARFCHR
jgi:uncharacterized membrane protein